MMIDLMLQIGIALLAFWAVWKSIPTPPSLEWKYFHSLMLSTFARGALERRNASITEWKNTLIEMVGYHPENPRSMEIFSGEKGPVETWRSFFQDDSVVTQYLLRDPEELGRPFQPAALISWDDVALEHDKLGEHVQRKLSHAIVVGTGKTASELVRLLEVSHCSGALDIDHLSRSLERKDQRFLFVGEREEAQQQLQILREFPALRDRTLGVLLIDSMLDPEWLAENFTQVQMDAEANVAIPYLAWSYVDPDALQPWTTIEEPEIPDSGWKSIEVIDLGAFPMSLKQHQKWMNLAICFVLCKRMEMV